MSERKLKGYAVKMVDTNGKVRWVIDRDGLTQPGKNGRAEFQKITAHYAACEALGRKNTEEGWDAKLVAIYRKPKRSAAEERADTIAFLRTAIGPGIADALKLLESGVHEGASKAPCMVVYSDADTDAAQLEALGRTNG